MWWGGKQLAVGVAALLASVRQQFPPDLVKNRLWDKLVALSNEKRKLTLADLQ